MILVSPPTLGLFFSNQLLPYSFNLSGILLTIFFLFDYQAV